MYQMGALQAFSSSKSLQHLKPHGALYNDAVANENIASAICDVIEEFNPEMYLLALSGSKWVEIAINRNINVAKEAFADRTLLKDGSLAPRYEKGAVLHDVDTVIENGIRIFNNNNYYFTADHFITANFPVFSPTFGAFTW